MPLDHYQIEDPFENHPLFKSEEQARFEETLDGEPAVDLHSLALPSPGEDTAEAREPRRARARRGPLGSLARLRLGRVEPSRSPQRSGRRPPARLTRANVYARGDDPLTPSSSGSNERLRRYAELAVRVGANVQPGQEVVVLGQVEHAPTARAVVRAAYGAGAAARHRPLHRPARTPGGDRAWAGGHARAPPAHMIDGSASWRETKPGPDPLTGDDDPDLGDLDPALVGKLGAPRRCAPSTSRSSPKESSTGSSSRRRAPAGRRRYSASPISNGSGRPSARPRVSMLGTPSPPGVIMTRS